MIKFKNLDLCCHDGCGYCKEVIKNKNLYTCTFSKSTNYGRVFTNQHKFCIEGLLSLIDTFKEYVKEVEHWSEKINKQKPTPTNGMSKHMEKFISEVYRKLAK